jgi:L-methionine (R)-S-oxide reductase
MTPRVRSSKRSPKRSNADLSRLPVWYQPEAPQGSAVRYVASLSPRFNWVGIYVLKGKFLELGPFIGAETDHTRIPIGRGVCGLAVAENRDQNVPDVSVASNYLACSIATKSELVVLIRDGAGSILGQIDIDSHVLNAFGPEEERAVRQVADELGALWRE